MTHVAEPQKLTVRAGGLEAIRRYFSTFALRAVAMGATSIAAIITARVLSPTDRGFLALVVVPVNYVVGFAGTGMRQPIAKYARADRSSPAAVGTLLAAMGLGFIAATAWGFARTAPGPAFVGGALCVAMVVVAFLEAVALEPTRINRILKAQAAVPIVLIGGAPLLYVLGAAKPLALISLQCIALVATAALFYRREIRSLLVIPRFSVAVFLRSVKHAVGTVALVLLCRIDVLGAVLVLPRSAVGQYVVASSFGEFMSQIPAFAGFLVFAETPSNAFEKRARVRALLTRAVLFSSAAAVLLAFAVPGFIRAVLGAQYDQAARLFVWLLPAYVIASGLRVVSGFLAATAENRLLVRMSVAGATTMAVLVSAVGVAAISPIGIGLCAAAAELVAASVLLLSLRAGKHNA